MTGLSLLRNAFIEKKPEWITWPLLALFVVQSCICIYFNLFLLEDHMGYDSSWAYLKPVLMWREGALFSNIWLDQTGTYLDSSILPAALFYGLTQNPFTAYGLANILILGLIAYYTWVICKNQEIGTAPTLVCLNLLICPYMTQGLNSDLGYFSCVIGAAAFYNGRVLICLAGIAVLTHHAEISMRIKVRIAFVLILCLLSGMSVGFFMVVTLFAPVFLFCVVRALKSGRVRALLNREVLFVVACMACVMIGKLLASHLFHSYIADDRTWTSITDLGTNILAVVQGIFKLLNALPLTSPDYPILSRDGIKLIFPLAILAVEIIAVAYVAKSKSEGSLQAKAFSGLLLLLALWNLIVLSLFKAQYGSPLFEERYLICWYVFVVLLVAQFLERMRAFKLLQTSLLFALCVVLACNDLISDREYMDVDTSAYERADGIVEVVKETGAELAYVWAPDDDVESAAMERKMRVLDLDNVYKALNGIPNSHKGREGDYLYFDNPEDYNGKTAFVTNDTETALPKEIAESCTLYGEVDGYKIYLSDSNPLLAAIENQGSLDEEE